MLTQRQILATLAPPHSVFRKLDNRHNPGITQPSSHLLQLGDHDILRLLRRDSASRFQRQEATVRTVALIAIWRNVSELFGVVDVSRGR
jgi:hypothetical protein